MRPIDPIAELRRIMQERDLSQGKLADEMGIDRGYMVHLLAGRRRPGPKILNYLGLEEQIRYVRK